MAAMTKKINKGGRPTKALTPEQVAQTEALGAVLSVEQIADYFGIGKTTFYTIMERQPEVSERYKKGKSKAIGAVAQGLLQQARDGNTTAAMFYLKTQAGWRETQQIDHTGEMTIKTKELPASVEEFV
jgi:hypothetical protein